MKVSEIDPIPPMEPSKQSPKKVDKPKAKPESKEGFKEIYLREMGTRGSGSSSGGGGNAPIKGVDMSKRNITYKKGGSVTMAHRRADGIAKKGFTKGGI
jgi:hypothetical protein